MNETTLVFERAAFNTLSQHKSSLSGSLMVKLFCAKPLTDGASRGQLKGLERYRSGSGYWPAMKVGSSFFTV